VHRGDHGGMEFGGKMGAFNNYQQNNTVISVGRHLVSNKVLQLQKCVALTFGALHRVNWITPHGSVFVQQALLGLYSFTTHSTYTSATENCTVSFLQ